MTEIIPVLFRIGRSKQDAEYGVTAVFPTIAADMHGYEMTCYAHVGQHSGCSKDWLRTTRPATPDEYRSLWLELVAIGYRMRPRKRISPAMVNARRNASMAWSEKFSASINV